MNTRQDYLKELVHYLCRQSRVAGSDWNRTVSRELISRLQSMQYQVEVQEVEFTSWRLVENPSVEILSPVRSMVEGCLPVLWSRSIEGVLEGNILADEGIKPDQILTFDAYPWVRFPVYRLDNTLGAYLIGGPRIWAQPLNDAQEDVSYVMVPPDFVSFLLKSRRQGIDVQVRIAVKSEYLPGQMLHNIVAQTGPSPSILIGAHFDSFFNTVGAHDNASGIASLLCLAGEFAGSRNSDVMFVCFDGEEFNKLGSRAFVEELESSGKLDQVRWMVNIDSVGYGDGIYINIPEQRKDAIPEYLRSLKKASSLKRAMRVLRSQELQPFDAWPFVQAGIPAIQIGTFGDLDYPYWHDPMDNTDRFHEASYDLMADVVLLAAGLPGAIAG